MGIWPFASGWVLYVGWDVAFTLRTFLFAIACAMLAGISWRGIAAVVTATQKSEKYEQQRVQETPCFLLHHFVSPGVVKFAWKHLRRPRLVLLCSCYSSAIAPRPRPFQAHALFRAPQPPAGFEARVAAPPV